MATGADDLSAEQLAAFEAFTAAVRQIAAQRLTKYGHRAETSVGTDSMIEAPLTEAELVAAADPVLYDVLADAAVDGAVGVGLSLGENVGVYDPAVERIAAEHIAAVKSWLPEMVNEMTSWVQDGLREGYSIDEMVKSLDAPADVGGSTPRIRAGSPISDARARTIARTEVVGSSNGGTFAAYKASGFEQKTWLCQLDSRTRLEHAALHHETIPMDADFIVGGEPAKYPGSSSLSASMRVSCRCTLLVGDDYPLTSDHELALRSDALNLPKNVSREEQQLALLARLPEVPGAVPPEPESRVGMGDGVKIDRDVLRPGMTANAHLDEHGDWTPERQALHDKIVSDYLDGLPSPSEPELLFMGGGGGAGKSSMIKKGFVKLPKGAVTINADDLKDLLPETLAAKAAGDRGWAAAAHEESSYLAKRLQLGALERGNSIVLDAVGSNAQRVVDQVARARGYGYKVRAAYVSIPPEEGVARAAKRAADMDAKGEIGRHIPAEVVRQAHMGANEAFGTVADSVDEAILVDNTTTPKVIATFVGGERTIVDDSLWSEFLGRGFSP
jgi:predicted ABC-type ATPase